MEVRSGGSIGGATGTVGYSSSGTLQLDDSQHFLGRIEGEFAAVRLSAFGTKRT
jgi:hypothetical protein